MSIPNSGDLQPYLSTRKVLGIPDDKKINPLVVSGVENLLGIRKFNDLMETIGRPWKDSAFTIDALFEKLDISWKVENPGVFGELDDKPKIFVANHPYGLPDAFALFRLLIEHRPDIRIFANRLIEASQLNDERLLLVDPFGSQAARNQTRKSIAQAIRHLRAGGDLALFPGRICSHLKTSDWTISDSEWTDQIRKFVEVSGADLVPLYISGRNSLLFNFSGLIHPRIRTYMLMREFLRGGHDFTFRLGEPVSPDQLQKVSRSMSVGNFARSMVYSLKTGSPRLPDIPQLVQPELRNRHEEQAVSRKPVAISGAEVRAQLERHEVLIRENHFRIFHIGPGAGDQLLDMICEVRFRAYASETTLDDPSQLRDHYDDFYNHLVLWDDDREMVAGVYRYTLPNPSVRAPTAENLVTSSIFHLSPDFCKLLPNAMELGRAAILPEYQKSYSSLMMLWRGFLEIPKQNKHIKYLFGPVTMGKTFNPISRELLRRFIMRNCGQQEMRGFVRPRQALDFNIPREVEIEKLESGCKNFSQLGNIINGLERGKRSLPVLFRHYVNHGCKFIGFGEWRELDHATAGLTILDFTDMGNGQSFIRRYFGEEGAASFFAER